MISRYMGTTFLVHTHATDLNALNESIASLDPMKVVTWERIAPVSKKILAQLLGVGQHTRTVGGWIIQSPCFTWSCANRYEEKDWDVEWLLSSLWWLFN